MPSGTRYHGPLSSTLCTSKPNPKASQGQTHAHALHAAKREREGLCTLASPREAAKSGPASRRIPAPLVWVVPCGSGGRPRGEYRLLAARSLVLIAIVFGLLHLVVFLLDLARIPVHVCHLFFVLNAGMCKRGNLPLCDSSRVKPPSNVLQGGRGQTQSLCGQGHAGEVQASTTAAWSVPGSRRRATILARHARAPKALPGSLRGLV